MSFKNKIKSVLLIVLSFTLTNCSVQKLEKVTVKGQQFYKGDKPYSYIGANYWYGSLLASKKVGDRARLLRELDLMKKNGIDNLRVLVGGDGGTYDFTVRPALQYEQGKYDEDLLEGLDFLVAEMGKRNMYAVLYLNNNWEWSGGMSQYLEWNGYGKIPIANIPPNTWPQFMAYTAKFHSCEPCMEAFKKHIKFILGRTNQYNNKKYTEDNAIMAWQVGNEPRVFTPDNEAKFTVWLNDVVDYIDSLDKNHLISTGSEGKAGSNDDLATFERTHKTPNIDYLTMHIWPKNWGWYKAEDAKNTFPGALIKANKYIDEHIEAAARLNRPIIIEEFGLPRQNESLLESSDVTDREALYISFFDRLIISQKNKQALAGINFWGFGGEGKAVNAQGKWNTGDTFTADPPQEPQGLNTVFSSDKSTLKLIKDYNDKLKK